MIHNIVLALILALVVVSYWILCRRRAYQYQVKAISLMDDYFKDGQASDNDKRSLYQSYVMLRKWYIFPAFALATPFLLCVMLLMGSESDLKPAKRTKPELYANAYGQLMKMAISKNPIISFISMATTGVILAVLVPISVLLKRLKSVPRSEDYAVVMEKLTLKAASKAHIH